MVNELSSFDYNIEYKIECNIEYNKPNEKGKRKRDLINKGNCGNNVSPAVSVWKDNRGGLNIETTKMTSENEYKDDHATLENVLEDQLSDLLKTDKNHNYLVSNEHIKVLDLDITDAKVKKKSSAIESMRHFLRTNVTSPNSPESAKYLSDSDVFKKVPELSDGSYNMDNKKEVRIKKKKLKEIKYGKKRKRRPLAIQNEGASLWSPKEDCCWKSAANRVVRLEDTNINQLCDAEREILKTLALKKLGAEGFSNITIPKEKRVSPSRRWKQLLPLIRRYKGLPEPKTAEEQPQNPVFAIDLCQTIENDKVVEHAHEIAMAKLDFPEEAKEDDNSFEHKQGNKFSKTYYGKRNSDPLINKYSLSNGDKTELTVDNYSISNGDDLTHDRTSSLATHNRSRASRLIEALSLSSTSASSVCVLDRETEFKPPTPQVPKVMRHTSDFITKYGLNAVYIFRNEGSKKRVKKMREDYDNGYSGVVTETSNPFDVAALFKVFIRKLPEPLLTRELYNVFINLRKIHDVEVYNKFLKLLIWLLPVPNRDTLEVILKCLRQVADRSEDKCDDEGNVVTAGNKMDAKSIAIIMAPNVLYRFKGYKTNNTCQIEEENNTTIDVVHALINLSNELFVIEKDIHDEVLKKLLDTDPETVDYVLRKKSTRTSFNDMLKTFDESVTISSKEYATRPQTVKVRRVSNRENETELKKTQSFNQGKSSKRRHLSTVTRPETSRLDYPERGSLPKFSRNMLRMSLGSREIKSRNVDSKYSPLSSPYSSKHSISRKDKNSNHDLRDVEGGIPEHNRGIESSYAFELPGMFLGLGRKPNSLSLSSNNDSEMGSRNENLDIKLANSSESVFPKSASSSQEKVKRLSPAKDLRRKISLPAFLGSPDPDAFKVPYKTPSEEIEVFGPPPSEENPIERITEACVDYSDKENENTTQLDSINQKDKVNNDRTILDSINHEGEKVITEASSIDWSKEEDWPEWQLKVVPSGLGSQETTL